MADKELRKAYGKWRGAYDEKHERLVEKHDKVILPKIKRYLGNRGRGN